MQPAPLPPIVRFLMNAAAAAPSADNSQPWAFAWNGETLEVRVRDTGGLPATHHASRLAFGAVAENLAQALTLVGEGAGWSFGLPDARGRFAFGPVRSPYAAVPAGDPLPWERRRTSRVPYRLAPLPADSLRAVAAMATGRCSLRLVTTHDEMRALARSVQGASEIRFQTREVHEWLGASLRYGPGDAGLREGLHVSTLAVPPGIPALLKWTARWEVMERLNRLGLHRLFASIEAATFTQAPCVLAVVGPGAPEDAVDAGRLFERAWLFLAAQGLAGHPFYVLPDLFMRLQAGIVSPDLHRKATAIVDEARTTLGIDNQMIHCLIRVGIPAKETPRSLRRPIEELLAHDDVGDAPLVEPACPPSLRGATVRS